MTDAGGLAFVDGDGGSSIAGDQADGLVGVPEAEPSVAKPGDAADVVVLQLILFDIDHEVSLDLRPIDFVGTPGLPGENG